MEIDDIRKKLDEIDEAIVRLIAERLSYMPRIADYKRAHNLPIRHPEREAQILESKKLLARELGIDPGLIEEIFTQIFEASRKAQEK